MSTERKVLFQSSTGLHKSNAFVGLKGLE